MCRWPGNAEGEVRAMMTKAVGRWEEEVWLEGWGVGITS